MIMGYQKDLDAAVEAKDMAKMKKMSELIACLDQAMKEETAKNFDARPSSSTRPSTNGSSPPSTTPRPPTTTPRRESARTRTRSPATQPPRSPPFFFKLIRRVCGEMLSLCGAPRGLIKAPHDSVRTKQSACILPDSPPGTPSRSGGVTIRIRCNLLLYPLVAL